MAGNLFRGLSKVPWDDVIRNAPVVASVAREMWANVRQPAATPRDVPPGQAPHSTESPDVAGLQARLDEVESAASDLRHQMLESSEIIAVLAEQNTQLVKRIEANRVRTLWLTRATVVVGIIAALNLILLLAR